MRRRKMKLREERKEDLITELAVTSRGNGELGSSGGGERQERKRGVSAGEQGAEARVAVPQIGLAGG
jgi:hypothetical protein